ncbi:ankyrin repeat-containing domain protein [Xylaria arbuscula]|nr:ankyrin repeat-containing domain protein [Xylaria arbuscula]
MRIQQATQQHPPAMENHESHNQLNTASATVHFVSPQPTHPLPAPFEQLFPVANASMVEKGVSLALSDQPLSVYQSSLLDLPIGLNNQCDIFPLQQDTDSATPRVIPPVSWSHFENVTEPPETGQTFAHSSPPSQGIRQSSIIHDNMNDDIAAQTRHISTQATSSLPYSPFPPAANNLPSPAPSHNGEVLQKKPSQPTITPPDYTAPAQVSSMNPVVANTTQELQGCTPIFQAVALGNLNIASILVARGCNINAVNGIGQTVLHVAAQNGQVEMIEYLITCGIDLDHQDNGGNTALHLAVINGYEGIVELLINAGAKMDIMNN